MIRSRGAWARWLVPALVLLVTLKTTWGLLGTFDLGFDDETIYLEAAHWAGKRFLPLADSSPLYPLWYRALSFVEPDPIRLYFLNWFVLTAALPMLLYALARRSGAPLAAAAAVAVAWSMSTAVMTWPFVSKFAALVLCLGALAATAIRDRRLAVAVTAAALAVTAYARAELTVPSFVFAGAVAPYCLGGVVGTLRGPRTRARCGQRSRALLALGIAVLAPLGARRLFGDPHQGGRAFFAFGQHYALNVVEDRRLAVDPWTLWDRFAREAFPRATTIGEALQENPAAFLWHLRRNLTRLPKAAEELLAPLPFVPRPLETLTGAVLDVVVIAGVCALVLRAARLDRRLAAWLPLLTVVGLTTIGSTLLVYPREHYLLPLACLVLAALAAACGGLRWPSELRARWWLGLPRSRWLSRLGRSATLGPLALVVALVLVAAALPARRGGLPSLLASRGPSPPRLHENERTVELLRSFRLRGRVPILEADHSRGVYAELDFVRVAQWEKAAPFWEFVHAHGVAVVAITWRLREDPRFRSDPEFLAFADGTGEREDFELIPVPGTSVVLAVRKSAMARGE
ncbi:MAG: hypothetical protein KF850_01945 [Labilithrix sp.]|nr:hypothetical protein [Labilithrix sp.]